jgi:hypothetical protein
MAVYSASLLAQSKEKAFDGDGLRQSGSRASMDLKSRRKNFQLFAHLLSHAELLLALICAESIVLWSVPDKAAAGGVVPHKHHDNPS